MTNITDPTTIAATLFADLERAWNEADGTAFGEVFTSEADFVDIRGARHNGREAVAHGHQAIFDSIYAGSTIRYQPEVARAVTDSCVVAVAGATLDTPSGPAQGINRSRITAAITEHDGRWLVTAFQNTLVQEGS